MIKGLKNGDLARVIGTDECIEDEYVLGELYEFESYTGISDSPYSYNIFTKNRGVTWMLMEYEIELKIRTNKIGGKIVTKGEK